jgi:hypothetical protein
MRQDPKAYPRSPNPQGEKGAELATQVLLYALGWDWESRCGREGRQAAIAGIGGVEMVLVPGDKGDPEIELIAGRRARLLLRPELAEARFCRQRLRGHDRWVDLEEAQDTWPDARPTSSPRGMPSSAPTPYPRDDDKRLKWWDHNEKRVPHRRPLVQARRHRGITRSIAVR